MRKTVQQEREELRQDQKNKFCRSKLEKTILKSLETILVGALADFENKFGEIWAHGTDIDHKTDEELMEYKLWLEARSSIFARGETAKAICLSVLDRCVFADYDGRPYKYKLTEKKDGDD